mmetsp:Transcript_16225/g.35582  ORF Transcript_16225/g.35582 Transcript_16225/m.35582 type:complete len:383 (+) Transcript_16225:50-1198(+)
MGLTEEEYELQKKEERRRKDAERRARKTENGGYRPTEETRKKISEVLREKYANGEIKRKKTDPSKIRRGFVHSEETRKKISESLKKRWANDEKYRENMREKQANFNSRDDVRQRISQTLKEKWQDPGFRAVMMAKIGNREASTFRGPSHREKISQAMKARWQDAEYRKKVVNSLAAKKRIKQPKPVPPKATKLDDSTSKTSKNGLKVSAISLPTTGEANENKSLVNGSSSTKAVRLLQPVSPIPPISRPKKATPKRKVAKKKAFAKSPASTAAPRQKKSKTVAAKKKVTSSKNGGKQVPDADSIIDGLLGDDDYDDDDDLVPLNGSTVKSPKATTGDKEIRQDLYDLLYGEDDATPSSKLGSAFQLGDENLENFDPYGLDDF